MPETILGIGTQYVGKRDFAVDGSFVTTEFVTVFIPLRPVRSLRVKQGLSSTEQHFFHQTHHTPYRVLCEGKVNVRQAVYVWAFAALYVLYLIATFALYVMGYLDWLVRETPIYTMKWVLQFLFFMLPLAVPLLMRWSTRFHAWTPVMQCPCGSAVTYSACCQSRTEAMKDKERHFYKTFT